ncbi:autotransporter outer membrane beta-barrel domain-containing protein [Gilliamella apis]|uniref:autotransporter outer membrane beta-barrel domain-containing protein n=1 Tax=Gilliamella apis TaxID=1970738 RepID=UPI002740FD52|nr:autotransporter outer membrane beta-barrel domain-containing protein [Gilliamella apis]WLT07429.1 autotransporter outer membrane beta-barrel domain-containing protein [Gilliamella apis]
MKKKKLIILLSLAMPLTVNALKLQGTQTFTDEINIPITHDFEYSGTEILAGISITSGSNTIFKNNVTINMSRDDIHNLESGVYIHGIRSINDIGPQSSTVFDGDLNIGVKGENIDAIALLDKNSTVIINGKTTLTVDNPDDSDAIVVSKGNLILNGESFINGDIYAIDNGTVKINNKSIINGDIFTNFGGTVILDLAAGSKIVGEVSAFGDPDDPDYPGQDTTGIIKMNLAKGSSWELEGYDSYVTELSGQGNITFTSFTRSNNFGELVIENLKGASTFNLRTDIAAQQSDKIIISKSSDTNRTVSAEGTHTINLINNGSAKTTGNEKLTLVEIDENATNTAEFKTNHDVELGGYQYSLNKEGKDYVLTGQPITSSAMASVSFLNANYLMSYVETQTLLKRLGDMRTSGEFGDVWLRGFTGKLDSFSSGKLSQFDMRYHGFQFGADKQLSESSPFVIGAFVGQTYGDPNYRKGDGSLRSFNTGVYATYLDNSGFYIDGVAKYDRLKNQFKVRDTANNRVQGSGHSNGVGVSMELGQKFKINDFYIEPQTQLSYSHQNGTTINASNGLNVKLGNYNSLLGRASALFGYEYKSDKNSINLYAKTGIVREFDGDTYYKLNNHKESHSFKGNWWNNGVGINAQINQNHNIYLDLESSPGNKFDLLQVNGGYRYSF